MGSSYEELLYHTLGEDEVFFRGLPGDPAVPVLPAKMARCELAQAAFDGTPGATLEPEIWIQCGQVAGLAPDGDYLCEDHMAGWYCEICGIQLPEFGPPGRACAPCVENPVTLDDFLVFFDDSDAIDLGGESDLSGEPWDAEPEDEAPWFGEP